MHRWVNALSRWIAPHATSVLLSIVSVCYASQSCVGGRTDKIGTVESGAITLPVIGQREE